MISGWMLGSSAAAGVLSIPGQYPDLASAVGAAADGDVIEIAAGTYGGFPNAPVAVDLTIEGAGAGVTRLVLDGPNAGLAVHSSVRIASLTLSGAGIGRPLVVTEGQLTLEGAEILDGVTGDLGGLINVQGRGELIATGTTFGGGRARWGGAIALGGDSEGTFTGCTFVDNEVSGPGTEGGAVRASENASLSFTGCAFVDNRSVDNLGGALALVNGSASATVVGCSFEANTAGGIGGAIGLSNGNRLTVSGSLFHGGSARDGGAIACGGNPPCALSALDGTVFDGNRAERGGQVSVESGQASFEGVSLLGGSATADGGAIAIRGAGSSLSLIDVRLEGNQAGGDGGGVHAVDASLEAIRPRMCANSAGDDGGALYVGGLSSFRLTNGTFYRNTAGAGGAIQASERSGSVSQSTFVEDTSPSALGVIGHEADPEELLVAGSVFSGGSSPALHVARAGPIRLSSSGFFGAVPWLSGVLETDPVPLQADPFPGLDPGDCSLLAIPLFRGELFDASASGALDPDGSPADLGATGGPEADPALWIDADLDRVPTMWDCDDQDPVRSPLSAEIAGDGIDQDCDGLDLGAPDTGEPPGTDTGTPPGTEPHVDPTEDTASPVDDRDPRSPADEGGPEGRAVGCGCGSSGTGSPILGILAAALIGLGQRSPWRASRSASVSRVGSR